MSDVSLTDAALRHHAAATLAEELHQKAERRVFEQGRMLKRNVATPRRLAEDVVDSEWLAEREARVRAAALAPVQALAARWREAAPGIEASHVLLRAVAEQVDAVLAAAGVDAAPNETTTERVLREVREERARQEAKWGEQNHPDGTGPTMTTLNAVDFARRECEYAFQHGTGTWRHILNEEVAEAFAESDPARLRAELIQVSAVAGAWVEAIDRRAAVPSGHEQDGDHRG